MKNYAEMQLESDRKPPGFIERYCGYITKMCGKWYGPMLDVGCGDGRYVDHFRAHYQAVGIDKFSRDHDTYGDAEKEIPYPSHYFSVVHSKSLIEHTQDIEFVILEMWRVLKPGGMCVMLTPDINAAKFSFWGDIGHVNPFNQSKLAQLFSFADFKCIECGLFTKWPHGWRKPLRGMLIATGTK